MSRPLPLSAFVHFCLTPLPPLMRGHGWMAHSKKQDKLHSSRNNVALFSLLFISCQTREGYLENFFSQEKQTALPFLFIKT